MENYVFQNWHRQHVHLFLRKEEIKKNRKFNVEQKKKRLEILKKLT